GVVPAMAFCKSEEFTIAKVGNSFCNFVLFHYAINNLDLIDVCKNLFNQKESPQYSFPELSYNAWKASGSSDPIVKRSNASFLKWFAGLRHDGGEGQQPGDDGPIPSKL
ncbi:MAG: hypothetical protein ACYDEJ_16530, partial [Desulfitobacteriaceae bacterium]